MPTDKSADKRCREELDPAYRALDEFSGRLYEGVLGVAGMDLSNLPIISRSGAGVKDFFSSQIDYCIYPWLFSDVFPEIGKEQLHELCVVAQLGAESLIQVDKILDGHLGPVSDVVMATVLLGAQYKLGESVRRLAGIIDASSPFWEHFDELFREYIYRNIEEKACRTIHLPSLDDLERLASGKASLSKTITAAMAEIAGKRDLLPAIERSQDLFSAGYQLYDDVKDWRWDYENGQYSYLLKRAFEDLGVAKEIAGGRKVSSKDLGIRLYSGDTIPDILEMAADYLTRAEEAALRVGGLRWVSWMRPRREGILSLRSDLIEIRTKAARDAR